MPRLPAKVAVTVLGEVVKREAKIRFWVGGVLVFLLLFYLLRSILPPFVAGMAVAYFLDPLADRLEQTGISRLAATSIITVGFFMALVALLLLIVPVIEAQIADFVVRIPDYVQALMDRLQPVIKRVARRFSPAEVERVRGSLGSYAGTLVGWGGELLRRVLTGSLALVNILSLLFITPVVTFYLLRDWDRLVARVDSWLPRSHAHTIRQQFGEIDRTLAGFVRGQATVCLVLATYYAVALTLAGLDIGLIVGFATGMVAFIPYIGALGGFIVSMALALAQSPHDWTLPLTVAAVFVIGQIGEGNFLTPRLVGNRVGLHPVWIIFALLAGGALFGFAGVLLAVPMAAVVGVLVRFALKHYLDSPLYSGNGESSAP